MSSTDPHLPRPIRLFGRIRRGGFDLECPACGTVYIVRASTTPRSVYDEETGIFTCTREKCLRAYQLGINCWPLGRGMITPGRVRVPVDTVPTLSQAERLTALEVRHAALLREGIESRVMPRGARKRPVSASGRRIKGVGGPVNTGPLCTCPENWRGEARIRGRDANCPRHGGEAGREPEEE